MFVLVLVARRNFKEEVLGNASTTISLNKIPAPAAPKTCEGHQKGPQPKLQMVAASM